MAGTQAIESTKFTVKRGVIFHVEPELLVFDVDEGHPLFESDRTRVTKLDEDMILSIMAVGIREPVTVAVEVSAKGVRSYLVVDGRRRVFNALEANRRLKKANATLHLIPVCVAKGDENLLTEIMISANEIRKDHSTMAKADKAAKMLDRTKDVADVARAFGVTRSTIDVWSKLATLCNHVRKLVDSGAIAPTAAAAFAGMSPAEQTKAVDAFIEKAKAEGVKPTKALADSTARGTREGRDLSTAPSRKHLKALVEHEDLSERLDPMVIKTIKWILGDSSPKTVDGLAGAINALNLKDKEKRVDAAAKKAKREEKAAAKAVL